MCVETKRRVGRFWSWLTPAGLQLRQVRESQSCPTGTCQPTPLLLWCIVLSYTKNRTNASLSLRCRNSHDENTRSILPCCSYYTVFLYHCTFPIVVSKKETGTDSLTGVLCTRRGRYGTIVDVDIDPLVFLLYEQHLLSAGIKTDLYLGGTGEGGIQQQ